MSFMSMTSALLSWGLWGLTASFLTEIESCMGVDLSCVDFDLISVSQSQFFTGSPSHMPVIYICALLLRSAVKLFNPISTLQELP